MVIKRKYGRTITEMSDGRIIDIWDETDNSIKTKMFLFARWLSTCYADELMDSNGKTTCDCGFDRSTAISVLNRANGGWYKSMLKHFNDKVYPKMIMDGSIKEVEKFLED